MFQCFAGQESGYANRKLHQAVRLMKFAKDWSYSDLAERLDGPKRRRILPAQVEQPRQGNCGFNNPQNGANL